MLHEHNYGSICLHLTQKGFLPALEILEIASSMNSKSFVCLGVFVTDSEVQPRHYLVVLKRGGGMIHLFTNHTLSLFG